MKDRSTPGTSAAGIRVSPTVWAAVLLLVAAALTWYDGVARALADGTVDFDILYAGARLLLEGGNPYAPEALATVLPPDSRGITGVQVTFPGTFALLAPVAALRHDAAFALWLVLQLGALLACLALLPRLAGLPARSPHALLLVAACALLGPFRMVIRQGQLDTFTLLALLLTCLLLRRPVVRVLLLGIAVAAKPTSIGLFAVHRGLRGDARGALAALLLSLGIILGAAWWLHLGEPGWWSEYRSTVASAPNDFNRVDAANPRPWLLTQLAAGAFAATGSASSAALVGYLVCVPVLVRTLLSVPRAERAGDARELWLLELSIVALVGLLVVYHRFYSGTLLVLPLAWAVRREWLGAGGWPSRLVLVGVPLGTLVNGQAAVHRALDRGWLRADGPWVDVLLAYHYVWLQVVLMLGLFVLHVRATRWAPGRILVALRALGGAQDRC